MTDYWKERLRLIEESQHREAANYADEISKVYDSAIRDIEKDLAKWYTRFATEEGISYSEAKRLLNTRELKEFRMTVEEYVAKGESLDPKWAKELERASVKFHVSRLEAIKVQVQQQAERVKGSMADSFDDFAIKTYSDQYYKTLFEVQTGARIGFDVTKLDDKMLKRVINKPWSIDGRTFSSRIWSDRDKLVNEVHQVLTRGVIQGTSLQKMSKELANRMGVSEANAKRLIYTENAAFSNLATLDSYKELGLDYYEIVATLDTRTSEICRDMDGHKFKLSEFEIGVTAPPFHPHCRTTTAPYFPEDEKLGLTETRATRDSEGKYYRVPSSMKYKDWYDTFVDGGTKEGLTEVVKDTAKDVIFEVAQSLATATDFAKSMGVSYVSFNGVDLGVANSMNQSLSEHLTEFPQLQDNIQFFGSIQEKKNFLLDDLQKYYEDLYQKYISVYGEKTIRNKIKSLVNRYFRASGEYAHAFDHRKNFNNKKFSGLAINKKWGANPEEFLTSLKSDVASKYHPIGCDTVKSVFDHEFGHQLDYLLDISDSKEFIDIIDGKVNADSLSRYALKNRKETLAEAWAEYRNNPNPRPLAKAIGELIESKYKARFGK